MELKEKIAKKYNGVVNYIDNRPFLATTLEITSVFAAVVTIAGFINYYNNTPAGIEKMEKEQRIQYALNNAYVDAGKNQFPVKDVYVVYSTDSVDFCTKKVDVVTEGDKVEGNMNSLFGSGSGEVGEYYYRDVIYGYYDIEDGAKVCEDHEYGYYTEPLNDVFDYRQECIKNQDARISVETIKNDVTLDYLLSRDPGTIKK